MWTVNYSHKYFVNYWVQLFWKGLTSAAPIIFELLCHRIKAVAYSSYRCTFSFKRAFLFALSWHILSLKYHDKKWTIVFVKKNDVESAGCQHKCFLLCHWLAISYFQSLNEIMRYIIHAVWDFCKKICYSYSLSYKNHINTVYVLLMTVASVEYQNLIELKSHELYFMKNYL